MIWSTVHSLNGETTSTGSAFGTGSQIGVIDIDGVITDADKLNAQIRKFGDDSSVKAIILHINSPGGGAAADLSGGRPRPPGETQEDHCLG
jgi:protease-4